MVAEASDAPPPIGSLDQYALAKKHPYVCTGIEQGDIKEINRRYTWFFTTSDPLRGDSGCEIVKDDKRGDNYWTSKNRYFKRNNWVILSYSQVIKCSVSDTSVDTVVVNTRFL